MATGCCSAGSRCALGPGEALHVAGANGIGKSSLIRILAGLLRPFAGAVARSGGVGLLDERPALDPTGSACRRRWASGPRSTEPGRWRSPTMPMRWGSTICSTSPSAISPPARRKRAALARLMGQQAPIWLLDEPLNGLDPAGRRVGRGSGRARISSTAASAVIASHQRFAVSAATLTLAEFAA